jgi:hypothetical protein
VRGGGGDLPEASGGLPWYVIRLVLGHGCAIAKGLKIDEYGGHTDKRVITYLHNYESQCVKPR